MHCDQHPLSVGNIQAHCESILRTQLNRTEVKLILILISGLCLTHSLALAQLTGWQL
jgi:hypothetical protein